MSSPSCAALSLPLSNLLLACVTAQVEILKSAPVRVPPGRKNLITHEHDKNQTKVLLCVEITRLDDTEVELILAVAGIFLPLKKLGDPLSFILK